VARRLNVPEAIRKSGGVVDTPIRDASSGKMADAVQNAAAVLGKQSLNFVKRGGCDSCHNQSIPSGALAVARARGITVPAKIFELPAEMLERSAERTMNMGVIRRQQRRLRSVRLGGMARPADEYTDSLVHY
jgi:hypothetical protein